MVSNPSFSHFSSAICIIVVLAGLLACGRESSPSAFQERPNLILIMADDLGYGGLGCFGNSEVSTPALDSLASKGLRFFDYHSNGAVCSPTRASILTGMYPQRSGLEGVIYARGPTRKTGLDPSRTALAEILRQHGYKTGIMGKWHLGYDRSFNPVHHGFEDFRGFVSGNIDYHSHYDNTGVFDWWHDLDTAHEVGYTTDLITKHSIEFIRKNHENPFFLFVSHEAPHVPFQGRNDPAYRFSDNEFTYYGPVEDRDRAYREMIEVMDEGIAKIMATLDELKLTENTLVVFVSDNGAEPFGHNGNLRAHKGSLFEGGHRVPGIAFWKNRIVADTTSQLVVSMDWYPTFLTLAGIDEPMDIVVDGIDLSRLLLHNDDLPERPVFWKYRDQTALRMKEYKLLIDRDSTYLFDLATDQGESSNLVNQRPHLADSLSKVLNDWRKVMESIPQKTR